MCANCIFDILEEKGYYNCIIYLIIKGRKCAQKFDPAQLNYAPPTNILFFEMLEKIEELIRHKEWEGVVKDDGGDRIEALLRI